MYYKKNILCENVPAINELKEMLKSNNQIQLKEKIQVYAKNIAGTVSQQHQVREQFKSTPQHSNNMVLQPCFYPLSFMQNFNRSLKVMLCNIRIFWASVLLKVLRCQSNISSRTYLGQNSNGIVLKMLPLEVLLIAMVQLN